MAKDVKLLVSKKFKIFEWQPLTVLLEGQPEPEEKLYLRFISKLSKNHPR